jgi:hypothetical protein
MPISTAYIRFIRNAADNGSTDDHAAIRRTGVDQYELTYTTTSTDSGEANIYRVNTDDRGIFRWFRSVIGLLEADAEPFTHVQLDFPAAPSVLIKARCIGEFYHTILNALDVWLDDGVAPPPVEESPKTPQRQRAPQSPVAPNAPARPAYRSHHMFFDIGDD